jgi:hypothetical protein
MQRDCVVGVFGSTADAQDAVARLHEMGWGAHVSLITRGKEDELDATAPLGAAAGGALGLLAGSTLLMVPGIGPVVFAGAMASGITGGLVGGLVGAMSGWGVKEDRVPEYEQDLQEGKTIVLVGGDPLKLAEAKSILDDTMAERVVIHAESADSTVDA